MEETEKVTKKNLPQPCPFCGNADKDKFWLFEDTLECQVCGVMFVFPDKYKRAERWNDRYYNKENPNETN